ncbi:MAG: molybdopterin-dependent oxidoreductase [Anaerolineae bacterium]|nr:molybdopterin-dependent oxidoreductase [Anaerolineae bacterium]
MTQKPTLWIGMLVGALLTLALTAVFFLATQAVGTPFPPFDVFDWVGRVLPGVVITFGIDIIVSVITTFQLGETSSAAKVAEQFLAVAGLFVTGSIAGTVLFMALRRVRQESHMLWGLITGLVVGVPVMLISASVNRSASTSVIVSSAWIIAAFALWGLACAWAYRQYEHSKEALKQTPANSVQQVDRRRFLVTLSGATAGITVAGTGIGALLGQNRTPQSAVAVVPEAGGNQAEPVRWSAENELPNTVDTLVPAPGTRAELTPLEDHYRIDINTLPPVIEEADWSLQFSGLVEAEQTMTLQQIRAYEQTHQFVTLACISNRIAGDLIGTQRWTGVSLKRLLEDVALKPNATHLKVSSADNFDEFVSLDLIRSDERIMLAYEWDGLPLEVKHGFPLRIYIPDHYGMKQPKWITNIEAVEGWQEGYWVRRGWDKDALMRATSVIDTVAVDEAFVGSDNQQYIPIGGIAHAGDRGISKVEIKVDEGEWIEARLRSPLSGTTWVIWRYDWPFQAGEHVFTVRCTEGDGAAQIEALASSRPSGATGLHSIRETV